jgi:elongation factor G
MKTYPTDRIYSMGLFSHGGAGKTTLAEAALYDSGAISRIGRVDDGNTVSDYDVEEIKRKMSMHTTPLPIEWADCKINLLDTPGYADFVGEMVSAMWVVDGAVVFLCAASGVEVGAEIAWELAGQRNLPRVVFINKMDSDNASFARTLEQAQTLLDPALIPVQLPIGAVKTFTGVVDLLQMKAFRFSRDGDGKFEEIPIPEELRDQVEEARMALIEKVAETDDALIEKYLEGVELTPDEVRHGLRQGVREGTIVPVLCGSAALNIGVPQLLDTLLLCFPSAAELPPVRATDLVQEEEVELAVSDASPLTALVFKTLADPYVGRQTFFRVMAGVFHSDSRVLNAVKRVEERIGTIYVVRGKEQIPVQQIGAGDIGVVTKLAHTGTTDTLCTTDRPLLLPPIEYPAPVFTAAIRPETKSDLDKMGAAMNRVLEEDPTLRQTRELETGEILLSGMGESHVQLAVERVKRKYDVSVLMDLPLVPYRETIRKTVESMYRHKKQTGGRGQFAEVHLRLEPLDYNTNEDLEFVNEVVGGVISRQYIPGVEKGVREAMLEGVVAGYRVVGVRVAVYYGKEHPVDSSELAFKLAGLNAFKEGEAEASPVLLEPIVSVEITVPDNYTGDIMGDLNSRRARVQGMDPLGGRTTIRANAPMSEMQRYSTDLRSMTGGRGLVRMAFDHYEEVPAHVAESAIAEARRRKEERQM